jgi:hypothetical protein
MDHILQEKAELVLLHAGETAEEFRLRHPTKLDPQQGTVSKLMKRSLVTGGAADRYRSSRVCPSTDQDYTVTVVAKVATSPHRSMQKTA